MKLTKIIKTLAVVGSACIGLAEVLKRVSNLGLIDEFTERPTEDVKVTSEKINTEKN